MLPQYDYLYLGDNARNPYGTRSFDIVYEFSRQAVDFLFSKGCPLIVFACNTASAKALRTIQQKDLISSDDPTRRVLGIIRPTVEVLDSISSTKHIGVMATSGTIDSQSYVLEIEKLFPDMKVTGEACPMWVPLVENLEYDKEGANYFVKKHIEHILSADPLIDTLILACTHYPLLENKIREYLPSGITLLSQGDLAADSLADYLQRHPEMERRISLNKSKKFMTTESVDKFTESASIFLKIPVTVEKVTL
jgi:glutamate racemase